MNEIQTLHPKILPSKTSRKLATAQGSSLKIFGKIQLLLIPTRTIKENKLLTKTFKHTFHILGIPFITIYIVPLLIS